MIYLAEVLSPQLEQCGRNKTSIWAIVFECADRSDWRVRFRSFNCFKGSRDERAAQADDFSGLKRRVCCGQFVWLQPRGELAAAAAAQGAGKIQLGASNWRRFHNNWSKRAAQQRVACPRDSASWPLNQ